MENESVKQFKIEIDQNNIIREIDCNVVALTVHTKIHLLSIRFSVIT